MRVYGWQTRQPTPRVWQVVTDTGVWLQQYNIFFISFILKQNTVTTMYLIHHYYNNDGDLIVSIIKVDT